MIEAVEKAFADAISKENPVGVKAAVDNRNSGVLQSQNRGDATGRRQRLACWRATGGRRGGRRVGGSDWTARDADWRTALDGEVWLAAVED
nr:hypothetical protein Iba_scaffold130CG0110 [Ipomoea batatas]